MRKRSSFVLCLLLSIGCAVGQYAPSAAAAPQQVSVPATTASLQPAIDCSDHADGLYVRDPNQCNDGFYKCANGRSFYYRCPTGLYFGIEDAQCQYKQLIPACGGERPAQASASAPVATVQVYQPSQAPPVYSPPQTQAPPVYSPPQTQAPPVYAPPQTQAPPVYVPPQTQAPYVPPTTQAPVYQPPPTTQAPVYQPPPTSAPIYRPPIAVQASVPSYQISYAQTAAPAPQYAPQQPQASVAASAPQQYSVPQQPQAPIAASVPQQYQYASNPAPAAPQFVASTQPPVDFNCGSNPDGFYSKQQCAPVYYSCSGGIATQHNCHAGTVYDNTAHICEYVADCGKPRTTTRPPMVNYGYGWQAPTTTTPSALCVGRTDGFYARGRCVPRYLHCSNGHAFDLSCPAGLVFRNDSCTYLSDCLNPTTPAPIAIQAPTRPTPPPLTWCRDNQKQDGYYSQGCSNEYYSCLGGFTSKLSCPASLVYDQSQSICEERQYVIACGGHPRPPTTTTIAAPRAPVRPVNFNCGGKADGYYVTGCSSTYYSCNGGTAIELQCPTQLIFDTTNGACEERQFVVACGGRVRPTTVPTPVAPARPVNFNCGGKADGYYSNVGCGAVYYHCNGGTAIQIDCPAGLSYSAQLHTCDYRSNIPECGGQLPTTTKSPSQSGYGYAPQTTQAPPVYSPPQTQAPIYPTQAPYQTQAPYIQTTTQAPVYSPPQTQAPPVYAPPQTQAPPVYVPPQTQAPPVYVPPQTQAPPVYVQPTTTTQAPYQPPQTTQTSYQPAYSPQQQVAAEPSAPVAVAQTSESSGDNACAHLQNGIYGRRCSRHYFVCTDQKIFEFTCPSGFAYDRTIARCGPIGNIQGCNSSPMPPAPQPAQGQSEVQPPSVQPGFRYKK